MFRRTIHAGGGLAAISFKADSGSRAKQQQPKIYLTVRDDDGLLGIPFPEDVDELYLRASGVIKEVERLKALFGLFAGIAQRKTHRKEPYPCRH